MSASRQFNDCGCCEGLQDRTPAPLFNRPGLSALSYRAGTYSLFKQSMLAGLTRAERPALGGLRTRADDDFSVALIDAWAVAGDVLTFYIERTVQEHYLATATERRSVDDLVQLIDYHLLPGVAATTWLSFTLETSPDPSGGYRPVPVPGVPATVPIAERTRVQSIPGPGELPQTFETVEEIEALAGWNTLQPRLSAPHIPANGDISAWFAGVGLDLNPGDLLLFVAADWGFEAPADPGDRWDVRRVTGVEADAEAQRTRVHWHGGLEQLGAVAGVAVNVFVLRQRASLFGYNAPDPRLFSDEVRGRIGEIDEWSFNELVVGMSASTIRLNTVLRGIEPGSWLVLTNPVDGGVTDLVPLATVSEQARSAYGVSAQVTTLTTDRHNTELTTRYDDGNLRNTGILLDSDPLQLAEPPLLDPVSGNEITLSHDLDPIEEPRTIIVRGKRAEGHRSEGHDLTITADDGAVRLPPVDETLVVLSREIEPEGFPGEHRWRLRAVDGFEGFAVDAPAALTFQPAGDDAEVVTEVATVQAVDESGDLALLLLEEPLENVYDRTTTEVFGNVARATHGETVEREVLGSGDGAQPYQQFTLRKDQLTYVRSETPGVIESELEIWVNDVRWHEVQTLFGHGPRDRVYITRITDDGKTVVQFGDGESGARLPTGQNNIVATYRTGIGLAGEVDAGQLSLLMTRPLGVRSVSNPIAPDGAVDRQEADDARLNAPRSVLTLGRIVSLQDYEDYARNSPGIDKAAAVWTWDGERRGVLITIAGIDGEDVLEGELVHSDLVAAMLDAGSPRVPFLVKNYRRDEFRLTAKLRIDPDRVRETVLQAVRAELTERFSFEARAFGQIVTLSEIYAAIHAVPGVVSVDIDHLYRGTDARRDPYLIAEAPRDGDPPTSDAAELLTLDAASLNDLEVLA